MKEEVGYTSMKPNDTKKRTYGHVSLKTYSFNRLPVSLQIQFQIMFRKYLEF